jgi:hypothetical protein
MFCSYLALFTWTFAHEVSQDFVEKYISRSLRHMTRLSRFCRLSNTSERQLNSAHLHDDGKLFNAQMLTFPNRFSTYKRIIDEEVGRTLDRKLMQANLSPLDYAV